MLKLPESRREWRRAVTIAVAFHVLLLILAMRVVTARRTAGEMRQDAPAIFGGFPADSLPVHGIALKQGVPPHRVVRCVYEVRPSARKARLVDGEPKDRHKLGCATSLSLASPLIAGTAQVEIEYDRAGQLVEISGDDQFQGPETAAIVEAWELAKPQPGKQWLATPVFRLTIRVERSKWRALLPGSQEASRSQACSNVAVTQGTLESSWLLEPLDDNMSSDPGISSADIARASDSTIFVIDRQESRVVQFGITGKVLQQFGKAGNGPGEFSEARAIAVTDSQVYVGDSRGYIHSFNRAGHFLRSIRVPADFVNLRDIEILPNGNIAVAARTWTGPGPYVGIVSPEGAKVRDLLQVGSERWSGTRPLLSKSANPVQLSFGQGTLAVWYPFDNYLELFDTAGLRHTVVSGCLPKSLRSFYEQQSGSDSHGAAYVITHGVAVAPKGRIWMASFHFPHSTPTLRVRQYEVGGGEVAARDYELPKGRVLDRVEFLAPDRLLLFHSMVPEAGIQLVRLH